MKNKLIGIALLILAAISESSYAQEQEAQLFVNKCPEKLFIGAIMNSASLNEDTYQIEEVALNPITVAYTPALTGSHQLEPSYDNMTKAVRDALQSKQAATDEESFSFTVQDLKSYGQIAINWGQQLDLQKFLYIPNSLKPEKNAILIDISRIFFSITMDLPAPGTLSNDPKLKGKENELIFVNNIKFGKKYTVVVESNLAADELKAAAKEAMEGNELSEKSKAILSNSTIRMLATSSHMLVEPNADNPFEAILKDLKKGATPEDFGVPVFFMASSLKDNASFVNKFHF